MISKITLTLEQDEQMGTNAAMEETIKLLGGLDAMPAMKLVLTLECEDVIAESYRAKLRHGLRRRPIGIKVKMSTKTDEDVACEVMRPTTPMDDLLGDGVDSVTLSSASRSVTLTPDTGARAKEWAERTQRLHVVPSEESDLFPGEEKTAGEKALEWLESREQD